MKNVIINEFIKVYLNPESETTKIKKHNRKAQTLPDPNLCVKHYHKARQSFNLVNADFIGLKLKCC